MDFGRRIDEALLVYERSYRDTLSREEFLGFVERLFEEQEFAKDRYETAIRVLAEDAGVTERDLDLATDHASPVRRLRVLRGERVPA